jgi:hypothetical protein
MAYVNWGNLRNFRPFEIRCDLNDAARFKNLGFSPCPNLIVEEQLKFDSILRPPCRPNPSPWTNAGQRLALVPSEASTVATNKNSIT